VECGFLVPSKAILFDIPVTFFAFRSSLDGSCSISLDNTGSMTLFSFLLFSFYFPLSSLEFHNMVCLFYLYNLFFSLLVNFNSSSLSHFENKKFDQYFTQSIANSMLGCFLTTREVNKEKMNY
jgi:hypothetical protein